MGPFDTTHTDPRPFDTFAIEQLEGPSPGISTGNFGHLLRNDHSGIV